MMAPPSPQEILQARLKAGLSVPDAASIARVSARAWYTWEAGTRAASESGWELFLLFTGQHPLFKVVRQDQPD